MIEGPITGYVAYHHILNIGLIFRLGCVEHLTTLLLRPRGHGHVKSMLEKVV
jgi:hypothetical protein